MAHRSLSSHPSPSSLGAVQGSFFQVWASRITLLARWRLTHDLATRHGLLRARGHDRRAEGPYPSTGAPGAQARHGPPSALARAARAVPPRSAGRGADARGPWAAHA